MYNVQYNRLYENETEGSDRSSQADLFSSVLKWMNSKFNQLNSSFYGTESPMHYWEFHLLGFYSDPAASNTEQYKAYVYLMQ